METGTIVKFAEPENEVESNIRMSVVEDNGNRVLVEILLGWNVNPTQTIAKSDLIVA